MHINDYKLDDFLNLTNPHCLVPPGPIKSPTVPAGMAQAGGAGLDNRNASCGKICKQSPSLIQKQ